MNRQSDSVTMLPARPMASGAVTGTLVGFTPSGEPLVDPGGEASQGLRARTCVALRAEDIGKEVALVFESGGLQTPIILGLLQPAGRQMSTTIDVDGKTVVVTGQDTIVLRCGEASITLNRDGKIVIRGQHVVSHASGVNRIRGGSVQLN